MDNGDRACRFAGHGTIYLGSDYTVGTMGGLFFAGEAARALPASAGLRSCFTSHFAIPTSCGGPSSYELGMGVATSPLESGNPS